MKIDRRLKAAIISIAANAALVCVKFVGAKLSGSMALQADAFHSMSDILVSVFVLAGVLLSKGHSKWLGFVENAIALSISLLILGAGGGLLITTLERQDYALARVPLTIGFVWVCILVSFAVARYKIRVGRECDSPSLSADGHHSLMDMYSSVAVLVGLLGALMGISLDTLASFVVVMLIFKIGLEVMAAAILGMVKSEAFAFKTAVLFGTSISDDGARPLVTSALEFVPASIRVSGRTLGTLVWRRRRAATAALAVAGLAVYACSGFYRIQPDEIGVVLHWGRLAEGHVEPGLHYRLPTPVTRLHRVKANAVRQLEFGFRTVAERGKVAEPKAYLWESRHQGGIYEKVPQEAVMLTGDKNEVDVNLTLEYRVADDAPAFLFNVAGGEDVVRAAAESATRGVVGRMELEYVLTTERAAMEGRILQDTQKLLDAYESGVAVTTVRLQDVHPPVEVVPAFRRVATARENRATSINRARGYQAATIPKSRGLSNYIASDAQAYLGEKRRHAEGDAAYFAAMAEAFSSAPEAAAFAMHTETVLQALPSVRKVILSQEVDDSAADHPLSAWFLAGEFLKKTMGAGRGIGMAIDDEDMEGTLE